MYAVLLFAHSLFRWLVLISLLLAVVNAYGGYTSRRKFIKRDNLLRHGTATIAHIQFMIGMVIYFNSPAVSYFQQDEANRSALSDPVFFAVIHIVLMLIAVILITMGSAFAKRKKTDREKFGTILFWFSAALIIILVAIPWPFSPLANRPYFRTLHI